MSTSISNVWTSGAVTKTIGNGDNQWTVKVSDTINSIYQRSNTHRDTIDTSYYNWSIGVPELTQLYTIDNTLTLDTAEWKYLKSFKMSVCPCINDGYSSGDYVSNPAVNVMSQYISGDKVNTSGMFNNNRVVTEFDYSKVFYAPQLVVGRRTKNSKNAWSTLTYNTLSQFKSEIDSYDTDTYDYCILEIKGSVYHRIPEGVTSNAGFRMSLMILTDTAQGQICTGGGYTYSIYHALSGEIRQTTISGKTYLRYNALPDPHGADADILSCISPDWLVDASTLTGLVYALKCDYDIVTKFVSALGFWFTDGTKYYLPEIKNNATTGRYFPEEVVPYIDTENKNWGSTNDIEYKKPAGSSGDEEIEMTYSNFMPTGGLVKFYATSSKSNMETLSDALGNWDNVATGKDVLKNLISFKVFALPDSDIAGGAGSFLSDFVIAGQTLKDKNGNVIQMKTVNNIEVKTLQSITIPKRFNDFRDYEPYTKIEMFLPFIGWISLPSWCIGKTITPRYFFDVFNGTVKAVIWCSSTVVAEGTGTCAYDVPFSADAVGMKAGAVISSVGKVVASTAAVVGGIASGNVISGVAGIAGLSGSVTQLQAARNANYTEIRGQLGDGTNIKGLDTVYIKVVRPKNDSIPSTFGKDVGYTTCKTLTLTRGDGFTVVPDAEINGTMTSTEKQMIIDGLAHGLRL